jgi:hypothetical protein
LHQAQKDSKLNGHYFNSLIVLAGLVFRIATSLKMLSLFEIVTDILP